jgi:catechol 2,3-dioxygenase-like lactoylglutathione lyase family enzyme
MAQAACKCGSPGRRCGRFHALIARPATASAENELSCGWIFIKNRWGSENVSTIGLAACRNWAGILRPPQRYRIHRDAAAKFLADILNLEAGPEWGHFVPVKTANGVTLDFDTREEFRPGHYAFLVGDAEFDAALVRIRAQGVRYYADPRRAKPGEINYLHGGRGVYFDDPNGHLMEIITHPYGDPPEQI